MSDVQFFILAFGAGFVCCLLLLMGRARPQPEYSKPAKKRKRGRAEARPAERDLEEPEWASYERLRYEGDDYMPCTTCNRKGRLWTGDPCPYCNGSGWIRAR